jgi:hypothetical protein
MPAAPLAVFRRYLIVVPRSLPRRRDAVAAGKEQIFWRAAEKSKFYPNVSLNYPGAHPHGCCQLQPGGSEPPRQMFCRLPGLNALECAAQIEKKFAADDVFFSRRNIQEHEFSFFVCL